MPGSRLDWEEVEGCFVLRPPNGEAPEAVVHFLGGAFVGAAPQFSYRLLLEALGSRNVLVIATPYAASFDHLRIAEEVCACARARARGRSCMHEIRTGRGWAATGPAASCIVVVGVATSPAPPV